MILTRVDRVHKVVKLAIMILSNLQCAKQILYGRLVSISLINSVRLKKSFLKFPAVSTWVSNCAQLYSIIGCGVEYVAASGGERWNR
jgi:hypothetical protein